MQRNHGAKKRLTPYFLEEDAEITSRFSVKPWLTMKNPQPDSSEELFKSLIGLGDASSRKSYYPELLEKISELEKLNEQLEKRVNERTLELRQSLDSLKDTQNQLVESAKMASLGSLVAGVAHEINTPLGNSLTALSVIQQRLVDLQQSYALGRLSRGDLEQTLAVSLDALDSALGNLERAGSLVSRFREVAVDSRQQNLRELDLSDYIQEVIGCLQPQYEERGLHIRFEGQSDLTLRVDPGCISQIVGHLTDNAAVHGFEHGPGEIDFKLQRNNGQIELSCSDTGQGISPEVLKYIFEPFYTTQRQQGCTGLGLHLIFNLVTQQLGGTIRCESSPEKGTRFLLSWPLNPCS